MELPDLDRIVDTYFQIKSQDPHQYFAQLRSEFIPEIKKLYEGGRIIWFSFLVHGQQSLDGRVPSTDENWYVHIRLCPHKDVNIEDFIRSLPEHFSQPKVIPQEGIAGVDYPLTLKNQDWAYAWKLFGETSEWVLHLIEAHDPKAQIPIEHIVQFLHFATNPLLIGQKCLFFPQGFACF